MICEKPFTIKSAELIELKELAESKKLILVEAITTRYLSNYLSISEQIPQLGDLKIIECNYSQYSSRYDAFKKGEASARFQSESRRRRLDGHQYLQYPFCRWDPGET